MTLGLQSTTGREQPFNFSKTSSGFIEQVDKLSVTTITFELSNHQNVGGW